MAIAIAVLISVGLASASDKIENANTIAIMPEDGEAGLIEKAVHVVPTPQQAEALDRGFIGFVHIGPNTFSRREWGTGFEDPQLFDLKGLDTDQWVKAMKDAGMKLVILTVKHHDGFVLWQSRYTKHGIMGTEFEGGNGDIFRSLAESCARQGMKLGVYLSPADLYQIENADGLYGNGSVATERTIPRPVEGRPFTDKRTFTFKVDDYNEYFLNQLFELLTEYGPIHEVWLDGAHPKTKGGQTYDNHAWMELIHTLAPDAVVFGRKDLRWCGNEAGDTREAEWNVIPFAANPDTMGYFPDMTAPHLGERLNLQGARYLHYMPAEIDTSIREGWFYRDEETQHTRTSDEVYDIYERSVGGNAILLLNVPPNREGRFSKRDVAVLEEVGRRIHATYDKSLMGGELQTDSFATLPCVITIGSPSPQKINRVVIQEPIAEHGERIEDIVVEVLTREGWKAVGGVKNVGHKRIVRFPSTITDSVRIRIDASRGLPVYVSRMSAHYYEAGAPQLDVRQSTDGYVTIAPRKSDFGWKVGDTNSSANLSEGMIIRYTTDGTEPNETSPEYKGKLIVEDPVVLMTAAWLEGKRGAVTSARLGYLPDRFDIAAGGEKAFDGDAATVVALNRENPTITISRKKGEKATRISGVAYTPAKGVTKGHVAKAEVLTSNDGKRWKVAETMEYGNIVNDPSIRYHEFKEGITARYVRFRPIATADGSDAAVVGELMWY